MKNVICLLILPALGCYDRTPPAAPVVAPTPVVRAPVVVMPERDLVSRDVYVTGMRTKLAEFDQQLAVWNDRLEKTTGDAKVRMRTQMGELKLKRDTFHQEVKRLAEATGTTWASVKGNADRAYVEMKATFEKAAAIFG